mmetsp:Transcript_26009/g.56765  ORF Transcript_26009/g.56765 Transcript_26009/m.56765 type:complete len:265 (-) Transcript_26009:295-1089(-)
MVCQLQRVGVVEERRRWQLHVQHLAEFAADHHQLQGIHAVAEEAPEEVVRVHRVAGLVHCVSNEIERRHEAGGGRLSDRANVLRLAAHSLRCLALWSFQLGCDLALIESLVCDIMTVRLGGLRPSNLLLGLLAQLIQIIANEDSCTVVIQVLKPKAGHQADNLGAMACVEVHDGVCERSCHMLVDVLLHGASVVLVPTAERDRDNTLHIRVHRCEMPGEGEQFGAQVHLHLRVDNDSDELHDAACGGVSIRDLMEHLRFDVIEA